MRFRFYGGPYDGYHDVEPFPVISFPDKNENHIDVQAPVPSALLRHEYIYRKTLISGNPMKDPDKYPFSVWSEMDGQVALYEEAFHYIQGR